MSQQGVPECRHGECCSLPVLQLVHADDLGGHGGQGLLEHIGTKPFGEAHGGVAPLGGAGLQWGVGVGQAGAAGHTLRGRLGGDSCCLGTRAWRMQNCGDTTGHHLSRRMEGAPHWAPKSSPLLPRTMRKLL